jgi:hypothetical protein
MFVKWLDVVQAVRINHDIVANAVRTTSLSAGTF